MQSNSNCFPRSISPEIAHRFVASIKFMKAVGPVAAINITPQRLRAARLPRLQAMSLGEVMRKVEK